MAPSDFTSPLAILTASLLGSYHCTAMCGPLLLGAHGSSPHRQRLYHLGRLVSYSAIGGLSGYLGDSILGDFRDTWLGTALQVGIVTSILATAFWYLHKGRPPRFQWSQKILKPLLNKTRSSTHASLLGLFTPLLPCGWLYLFVLGAASTTSATKGAITLALFWLGTLPALKVTTLIAKVPNTGKWAWVQRSIVALLLIFAATNIASRSLNLQGNTSDQNLQCGPLPSSNLSHPRD